MTHLCSVLYGFVCDLCHEPTDGDDARPTACCRALHVQAAWPIPEPPLVCDPACECGAPLHEGETHEDALEADAAARTPGCTCPGYPGAPGGLHDGLCDLAPDTCAPGCTLNAGHGGDCDGRPEAKRWEDLFAFLDAGLDDDDLEEAMRRAGTGALPS